MNSLKKYFAMMILSITLVTQANAGILILTGTIGQNLRNPVAAGVCILVFLGGTGVGLVVDDSQSVAGSEHIILSEGGKAKINEFAQEAVVQARLEGKAQVEVVLTLEQAQQIAAGENLSEAQEAALITSLITKNTI